VIKTVPIADISSPIYCGVYLVIHGGGGHLQIVYCRAPHRLSVGR